MSSDTEALIVDMIRDLSARVERSDARLLGRMDQMAAERKAAIEGVEKRVGDVDRRVGKVETTLSNLTGRWAVIAVIGSIVATAIVGAAASAWVARIQVMAP